MYVTLKLEMFTVTVSKVNISVCSLKGKVKVKVTKFCVGLEDFINAYKPTKQGIHVINNVKENKLKSISVCVH